MSFFIIAFLAIDALISVVTGCRLTGCQKWSTLFWSKKNNERQEVLGVWEQSVLHDLLVLNFSTYSFWVEEIQICTKDQNEIFFFFFKGSDHVTWEVVHSFWHFTFLCLLLPLWRFSLSCSFALHFFKSSLITQLLSSMSLFQFTLIIFFFKQLFHFLLIVYSI